MTGITMATMEKYCKAYLLTNLRYSVSGMSELRTLENKRKIDF
jgi:hypothetical protein